MGRRGHACVILGYGGDHPQLLVTGGINHTDAVLKDAWMLDLHSWKWREVRGHDYYYDDTRELDLALLTNSNLTAYIIIASYSS